MSDAIDLPAEARARVEIDRQLTACGWLVQDRAEMNLYAGQGVAIREFIMAPGHGRADYLLFVGGKAVGAVEAKPSGTPLAGVESQTAKYAAGLPVELTAVVSPLPFLYESTGDLRADPGVRVDLIAANPPFGRKSSMTMVNEAGEAEREDLVVVRDDFWASTSNKQLNFLQHIKTMLKIGGRAAVVLPDNVLFEAGAGETIRRRLLAECDLHTILRLPTGIFYKPGVKANVVFFDRKPAAADAWTKETWVYDLRTNKHFTLKTSPLREVDLADFVESYCPNDRSNRVESERFHRFSYDDLIARDKANLDITWLRDESLDDASTLPAPGVLAAEVVEELEAALAQFAELAASLPTAGTEE